MSLLVTFPFLGNEVMVLREGVQEVCIEHGFLGQFLAQLVALQRLAALLSPG